MRILFYLPVVTTWWFSQIIAPMLRVLHDQAELHVIIASPLWRSTGLLPNLLLPLVDLDRIHWHVITDDDPELFRVNGAAVPGLLDLVASINPDLTLARSADQATPAQFPGIVRYIMEGGVPPFEIDPRWVILEDRLFSHGFIPEGAEAIGGACADALGPLWSHAAARSAPEVPDWRGQFRLPADRPLLLVPLQFEHEENYFLASTAFPRGADLIAHLLETLDEEVFLAITDHPLNQRMGVDRRPVGAQVFANKHRARICSATGLAHGATGFLAAHADAMLVDQSKSWSLAAFNGTPILRRGEAPMADWIAVSEDMAGLRRPDPAMARAWFGWHMGARLLDPTQFTLEALVALVNGTADVAMIESNLRKLANWVVKEAA